MFYNLRDVRVVVCLCQMCHPQNKNRTFTRLHFVNFVRVCAASWSSINSKLNTATNRACGRIADDLIRIIRPKICIPYIVSHCTWSINNVSEVNVSPMCTYCTHVTFRFFLYFFLWFLTVQKFNYIIIAVSLGLQFLVDLTHLRRVRERHGTVKQKKKRVSFVNRLSVCLCVWWRDARPFKWQYVENVRDHGVLSHRWRANPTEWLLNADVDKNREQKENRKYTRTQHVRTTRCAMRSLSVWPIRYFDSSVNCDCFFFAFQ